MSRDDVDVSGVPAACTPGWRDLPALAWVIARAYAPEGGARLVTQAFARISMVIWLPVLVSMRGSGQVVAVDRRAVVTVARLKHPAVLLGALAVLGVVGGWCVYTLDGASGLWLVGGALLVGTIVLRPWRVVRVQPAMWRVRKALSARDPTARSMRWAPWRRGLGTSDMAPAWSPCCCRPLRRGGTWWRTRATRSSASGTCGWECSSTNPVGRCTWSAEGPLSYSSSP